MRIAGRIGAEAMEPSLRKAVAIGLGLARIERTALAVDKPVAIVEPARGGVDRIDLLDQIRQVAAEPAVKHADGVLLGAVGGTCVEHMPAIGRCRKAIDRDMLIRGCPRQRSWVDEQAVGAGIGLADPEPGEVFVGGLLEKEDVATEKPLGLAHGEGRGLLEVADAAEQTSPAGERGECVTGGVGLLPQPRLHLRIVVVFQMPMRVAHGRAEVFAGDRIRLRGGGRRGFRWDDVGELQHGEHQGARNRHVNTFKR